MSARRLSACAAVALTLSACAGSVAPPAPVPAPAPQSPVVLRDGERDELGAATQLVLVTTSSWDTTGGRLRRFERATPGEAWRAVGEPVPVVVGRTGLAWDDRFAGAPGAPIKREGDGRAPAGIFPLSTVFGFAPASEAGWVRAPYTSLGAGTECVDDAASTHYNTIVDRGGVSRVDWTSAERMRQIDQYRLGVVVDYNTPARAGRGSCIFLHIWGGPGSATAGCTAMPERDLHDLVLWMDRARHPVLVQLTDAEHVRLSERWRIP